MSIVDPLLIGLFIVAVMRGIKLGLLRLVGSSLGIVLGLYLGTKLVSLLSEGLSSESMRLIISTVLVTLIVATLMTLGDLLGYRILQKTHARLLPVDRYGGAMFELLFGTFLIWLVMAPMSNLQVYQIGSLVRQSVIVSTLNSALPTPPDIVSELEHALGPNGLPSAFVGNEPNHAPINKSVTIDTPAVLEAEKSIVRVIGEGCSGAVQGSGFVFAREMVMTNAHVVAGVTEPYVYIGTKPYEATTVYFDSDLDVAVLKVAELPANALTLLAEIVEDKTPIVAMGHPGNGPLTVSGGWVLDNITAHGRNIYDKGLVDRRIYEIQAEIEQGNSGGPLIDKDGMVRGMVFGKSVSNDKIAYVILLKQLEPAIKKSLPLTSSVSTGRCISQ